MKLQGDFDRVAQEGDGSTSGHTGTPTDETLHDHGSPGRMCARSSSSSMGPSERTEGEVDHSFRGIQAVDGIAASGLEAEG